MYICNTKHRCSDSQQRCITIHKWKRQPSLNYIIFSDISCVQHSFALRCSALNLVEISLRLTEAVNCLTLGLHKSLSSDGWFSQFKTCTLGWSTKNKKISIQSPTNSKKEQNRKFGWWVYLKLCLHMCRENNNDDVKIYLTFLYKLSAWGLKPIQWKSHIK